MKNKIPFSFIPFSKLKNISKSFLGLGNKIEKNLPFIKTSVAQTDIGVKPEEYIAMLITLGIINLIFVNIILTILFSILYIENPLLLSFLISIPVVIFIFLQQIFYPKLQINKKTKNLERNLLPALQDILVQLN